MLVGAASATRARRFRATSSRMELGHARIVELKGEPLAVPLLEPFVIATARMDATRAVWVRARVRDDASGREAEGFGEAAALPPVTAEDLPDVLAAVQRVGAGLVGTTLVDLEDALARMLPGAPVARAGIECAVLDAGSRVQGRPLHDLLVPGSVARPMRTDITLPIAAPEHMAGLARRYASEGFDVFKVKVGKNAEQDRQALRAIHAAAPHARFRLDANEGFSSTQALSLLDELLGSGVVVECFEQPCHRSDLQGMRELTSRSSVPIVADESVRTLDDLATVVDAGAAHGVNLKLVKHGGLLASLRIATQARAHGLKLMTGAMVETRLGLTAMAHLVTALGGVEWLDLDTAFLLATDPFTGGYVSRGPELQLVEGAGLALHAR